MPHAARLGQCDPLSPAEQHTPTRRGQPRLHDGIACEARPLSQAVGRDADAHEVGILPDEDKTTREKKVVYIPFERNLEPAGLNAVEAALALDEIFTTHQEEEEEGGKNDKHGEEDVEGIARAWLRRARAGAATPACEEGLAAPQEVVLAPPWVSGSSLSRESVAYRRRCCLEGAPPLPPSYIPHVARLEYDRARGHLPVGRCVPRFLACAHGQRPRRRHSDHPGSARESSSGPLPADGGVLVWRWTAGGSEHAVSAAERRTAGRTRAGRGTAAESPTTTAGVRAMPGQRRGAADTSSYGQQPGSTEAATECEMGAFRTCADRPGSQLAHAPDCVALEDVLSGLPVDVPDVVVLGCAQMDGGEMQVRVVGWRETVSFQRPQPPFCKPMSEGDSNTAPLSPACPSLAAVAGPRHLDPRIPQPQNLKQPSRDSLAHSYMSQASSGGGGDESDGTPDAFQIPRLPAELVRLDIELRPVAHQVGLRHYLGCLQP
ncbi:hypothetical protein C2E23DRAFT_940419 [Lenzites betulinus]|nr:hypothetical protein C2E23DRAFT_940419 [Lenzites betulinus]